MTLATIAMFYMGITTVNAQEKKPQTVIIQVYAEVSTKSILTLLVTAPNSDSYEIPMGEIGLKNRKEAIINNSKIIQKEIDKWKNDGFVIEDASVTPGLYNFVYIIMSKD